ncbi:MAG: hypothetical protein ACREBW_06855, partial [Candidatus Micrarchaeaceae archaeon]
MLSAEKLLQLLTTPFLAAGPRSALTSYFDQSLAGSSRLELFKIAVLFHDIGKLKVLKIQPDGSTWCPG